MTALERFTPKKKHRDIVNDAFRAIASNPDYPVVSFEIVEMDIAINPDDWSSPLNEEVIYIGTVSRDRTYNFEYENVPLWRITAKNREFWYNSNNGDFYRKKARKKMKQERQK